MKRQKCVTVDPGALGDIRMHYVKAATYDATCGRYADNLARRDAVVQGVLVSLTAITSLGVFTSIFVDNPAWWAKLTVFALTATTAALTAVRNSAGWIETSTRLKERGADWCRQRDIAGDIAQRIYDVGIPATKAESRDLREREARLLVDHPRIPNDLYDATRANKEAEFDDRYGL